MKEVIRQEVTLVLKRVQGLEFHSQMSIVKFNQQLAVMEHGIMHAESPNLVREELTEVQQGVAGMWKTVYRLEVAQGKEAVFSGLTQVKLNSCKGAVKEWDADQEQWVVEDGGEKVLVKAGNTFVKDGHVVRLAILEQAAFSEWADSSDGFDG